MTDQFFVAKYSNFDNSRTDRTRTDMSYDVVTLA